MSETGIGGNRRGKILAILFVALLLAAILNPVTIEAWSEQSGGTRFELVRVPIGEAAADCAADPPANFATTSFARGATSYRFVPAINVLCGRDARGRLTEAYRMGEAKQRETQFVLEDSHVVRRLERPSTWFARGHSHFGPEDALELEKRQESSGD